MAKVAIITGTGFDSDGVWQTGERKTIETPYGAAGYYAVPLQGDLEVIFLLRHGAGHRIPPHAINYRANMMALHQLGVQKAVGIYAVGGLRRNLPPGTLVLCDQFLDFTQGRPFTFFDGADGRVVHTDVSEPFCADVREQLLFAATKEQIAVTPTGTYVCTQGPRFETAAEIKMFEALGGTVVGMTGATEAILLRELGICFANLSLVTNYGAGLTAHLAHQDVERIFGENRARINKVLLAALPRLQKGEAHNPCRGK